MYDADFRGRAINRARRVAFENRPKPGGEVVPMAVNQRAQTPFRSWVGNWKPRQIMAIRQLGGLGEDLPTFPAIVPTVAPSNLSPYVITAQPSGGWLSDLFSGLGKIITPTAQAIAQTKAAGIIAQQTQRTMAQTYNPAITGPAIQGQAWQAAYQGGTGVMPTAAISGTTLAILAALSVGVYLIARK